MPPGPPKPPFFLPVPGSLVEPEPGPALRCMTYQAPPPMTLNKRAASTSRPVVERRPERGAASLRVMVLPKLIYLGRDAKATRRFSSDAGMAPLARVPSWKKMVGVPLTPMLRPKATRSLMGGLQSALPLGA